MLPIFNGQFTFNFKNKIFRFVRALRRTGLHLNDVRLVELRTNLDDCQNFLIEHIDDSDYNCGIDFDCFKVNFTL